MLGWTLPTNAIVCTFAGSLNSGLQPVFTAAGLTGGTNAAVAVSHTNAGLPSNTIVLTAGIPLVWGTSQGYGSCPFSVNTNGAYVSCVPAAPADEDPFALVRGPSSVVRCSLSRADEAGHDTTTDDGPRTTDMQRSVVITGIRDIDRRLKSLLPRLQKKVIRQGMRAGLKLMKAEVEAQAPVETGATRSNVKVRSVRSRKRDTISMEVRIKAVDELKRTSPATGKTVFYPAIVEYKHNHFMKCLSEAKREAARETTIAAIRAGIEREAAQG